MKVYFDINEFNKTEKIILTTGIFDGVHLGHKKILQKIKDQANDGKYHTVVLTFWPHPKIVLYPDSDNLRLLNSLEEKIDLLDEFGIDHLVIHPFTKEFSRLSSHDFIRDIVVNQIGADKLIIGYDHHFGRNREGSFENLKEYASLFGFEVEEVPPVDVENINVSSTKIRQAIIAGDIEIANTYLGYEYMLSGTVTKGSGIGQKIGFPTANIIVKETLKLLPADGVYAVRAIIDNKKYGGMCNIGKRPTVSKTGERKTEVHIFNFSEDIYNKKIKVHFFARLRDEKKFENTDALAKQLEMDKSKALNLLPE